MSTGLETLLEAAQYIEQQERYNLSPQNGATSAIFNVNPHSTRISSSPITLNISHNNNNTSTNRNHQPQSQHLQHAPQQHVSLSAPAGSATFSHLNGLTNGNATTTAVGVGVNGSVNAGVGVGVSNASNGQLSSSTTTINTGTNLQHKQHDYEFTNSIANSNAITKSNNNVTIISARGTSTNGRTNDSRMSEDEDSSEISVCDSPPRIPSNSNSNLLSATSPATLVLLPPSTATATSEINNDNNNTKQIQLQVLLQQHQQQHEDTLKPLEQHEQKTHLKQDHQQHATPNQRQTQIETPFSVANSNSISNNINNNSTSTSNTVVASKQMLLNNGVRLPVPTTYNTICSISSTTNSTSVTTTAGTPVPIPSIITNGSILDSILINSTTKAIQIPQNGKFVSKGSPSSHSYPSLSSSNLLPSTTATTTIFNSVNNNFNKIHQNNINMINNINNNTNNNNNSNKTFLTLTPPPMPNRNFIEPSTPTRTRSYSLSHKLTANQLNLHSSNGVSGNSTNLSGNSSHMIIEDIHQIGSFGGNSRSPPRGNNYAHLLQHQQQQQAAGSGSQLTSPLNILPSGSATGGRRRTISSNSNGAGNREVHNKLEKNRRAHLKECYDQLKQNLPIKDEDRKKISNLSILGEAHRTVLHLQQQEKEVEADHEELAKKKIILQKRLNMLKRELGPKFDHLYPTIFNDADMATCSGNATNSAIPSEKETTLNETSSLSSGRGSMLYSSTSSLSSGGSNTMSSPVGAGLQTAMPTSISPVICKTISNITSPTSPKCNNSNSSSSNNNNNNNTININSNINSGNTVLQQIKSINISSNTSPAGSPNPLISITSNNNNINNNNNTMPLSLTAKNITATSVTRGSPTPSTPSPTSSSSSSISSGSSLISSSPPILTNGSVTVGIGGGVNGQSVISGRNTVTVNIPNGLKFASVGGATIGNGTATAAATIIATTTPGNGTTSNAQEQPQPQSQPQPKLHLEDPEQQHHDQTYHPYQSQQEQTQSKQMQLQQHEQPIQLLANKNQNDTSPATTINSISNLNQNRNQNTNPILGLATLKLPATVISNNLNNINTTSNSITNGINTINNKSAIIQTHTTISGGKPSYRRKTTLILDDNTNNQNPSHPNEAGTSQPAPAKIKKIYNSCIAATGHEDLLQKVNGSNNGIVHFVSANTLITTSPTPITNPTSKITSPSTPTATSPRKFFINGFNTMPTPQATIQTVRECTAANAAAAAAATASAGSSIKPFSSINRSFNTLKTFNGSNSIDSLSFQNASLTTGTTSRLPGGAELNILPLKKSFNNIKNNHILTHNNNNNPNNSAGQNCTLLNNNNESTIINIHTNNSGHIANNCNNNISNVNNNSSNYKNINNININSINNSSINNNSFNNSNINSNINFNNNDNSNNIINNNNNNNNNNCIKNNTEFIKILKPQSLLATSPTSDNSPFNNNNKNIKNINNNNNNYKINNNNNNINIINNNNNINHATATITTTATPTASAFFHSNGKLTFLNGSGNTNTIILKDSSTPLIVTSQNGLNGVKYSGNFTQLLSESQVSNIIATTIPSSSCITSPVATFTVPPHEGFNQKTFLRRSTAATTTSNLNRN